MDKKEKIKQIYQKLEVGIREEGIDRVLKDEEKTKQFMRLYKQEELDSMNYIFGKPFNNNIFTQFELEAVNKIDLFDKTQVEASKNIWKSRNKEVTV